MAHTQDGFFDRGIIKRLVKKTKTGKLGYVVEKDGKEKWYPLRFISLTHEQAEQLPVSNHNSAGNATPFDPSVQRSVLIHRRRSRSNANARPRHLSRRRRKAKVRQIYLQIRANDRVTHHRVERKYSTSRTSCSLASMVSDLGCHTLPLGLTRSSSCRGYSDAPPSSRCNRKPRRQSRREDTSGSTNSMHVSCLHCVRILSIY